MLRNRTFLKILSLLIAVFLWIYVMGEVNPETKAKISNIEVSFINTEALADRDLAVVQKKLITVDASIKGRRSDVNETKNSGLTATVDVSDCEEGKNTGAIVINLPDGVSLESISEDSVEFQVEDRVEEEKPVEIEFLGNGNGNSQSDLVPWVEAMQPDTVRVSGAESSVKKVSAVKGTISRTVVTENSRSVDVPLVAVTGKGDMVYALDLEAESAQVHVQLMSAKTVDINITPENIAEGLAVDKLRGGDSVRIVGTSETLAEIKELAATVDLKGLTSEGKVELQIDLPEGVYLYDSEDLPVVEVTLKAAE